MTATAGEDTLTAFDALIADADRHAQRVAALKLTDHQKREFAALEMKNNVWPMMGALVRLCRDAWLDHEEALDEILETEASVVYPELAAMVLQNFQAGVALVTRVRKLKVNDILRKDLEKLCADYEATMQIADKALAAAAVEPEEDEPEEEDGEDEETDGAEAPAADTPDPDDEGDEEEEDDDEDGEESEETTTPGEVG